VSNRWPSNTFRLFHTYSRYLTKICDQVVALLSPEHSASLVWKDEDSDTEDADVETGDSDRLFTFEVAETNEQEENAVARPGFQVPLTRLTLVSRS
jgi:acetyl-CoA carboxylase alpha subunit